ncbi:MAG TPA: hypothetical protein VJR29_05745 [bacterium]|nr:hypothetical protein [bacterium]
MNSLARERDPELLAEGLYHWARREEDADRLGGALRAYELLNGNHPGLQINEGLRDRVSRRLAVLGGGGRFGDRVEHLSRRFCQEATNPVAIAGMAAGSLVFGTARAAFLARLTAAGRPVFAARALASSGAFLTEVPAFWATTKGLNEFLHPGSQSWEMSQNLRELGGLALTLGALKLSGAAVGRGVAWARPNPLTQRLASQVGMLGGIMIGHHLETSLGLRPAVDAGSAWSDGIATLLQFNVGGRLSQSLLGPRFQAYSRELELRSRSLEAQARVPGFGGLNGGFGNGLGFPALAMAAAGETGRSQPAWSAGTEGARDLARPMMSTGAGGGEAPRLTPRTGRSADDRFERPMPAPEILQALQGREVLREIENHLEGEGRDGVSDAELGSAVGEALNRRIARIFSHPDYEPLRALTADRWRLDYSILPNWESLPAEFRQNLEAASELMQVTQFALRSNQSELSTAVQTQLSPEHRRVYRELVELIPILRGPRFTMPRSDIARGSEVIQADEAVLSHGTGDMSSLLKAIMRQSRPGGRPWYSRYFATDADARIVNGIRREGKNPNFTKPVRHNYEHDIPIEPIHNRDPLATALFRRVRVQLLNVPSTVLDRFLSEDYVRNLPEGAILVSAIGGLLNGGIERPRLPFELIRERLERYGRDDVEVVSMAGYIPGDKLWRGEHVEVNLSTREDLVKRGSPRPAAPLIARLLSGADGPNTYMGEFLSATVSHWDRSNNLGKVAKNVFTLMVGYEAGRIARGVVRDQSSVERNNPRWMELFELGRSRYSKVREDIWNMMQGLLVNNEGIKPLRARYNPAVFNDFDSCSKIEFENLVEVTRRAEALKVEEAAPGDITKFLQDNVFSPERHVASTRNPRRGIAQALFEGWADRGLAFTYEEVGPKVTTEGVDSLGPLLRFYDDTSLYIERRRLPTAVYDLHQAFLGRAVQPPPRVGDYLRMAIEDKPEDIGVINLQKGLQEIGLPASRLRPLLEGSSQDALRILNHEIRRMALLAHLEAKSPDSEKNDRMEEVYRQGELLRGLAEAMQKGNPVRIIRSPIHLGPYENAFIIQRQDSGGLTHQAFLRIRLEAIHDRMTSLGMFLRSFPPHENVDVQVRIPNLATRATNFKQLYELQMITQEITEAFRRHRPGSIELSLDRRPNDEKQGTAEPPAPEFYTALVPLAQWVQGGESAPGPEEVRALFRRSRHGTSQAIDEVLRSGSGWPMLMGPAPGPIQSGIRAMATRPEKATLMGVYVGEELVDTFAVYRYNATEPRILSHHLMRRFAEVFPDKPEYKNMTALDYFRGLTVDAFLRDYREYSELQNYGPTQVRTLPIAYAPVEHAMVGSIPEVNAGLLKLFLTEGSPASIELLRRSAPLYELPPDVSRQRFIELAQPYLSAYMSENGGETALRRNPLFELFRRFRFMRRRPRSAEVR